MLCSCPIHAGKFQHKTYTRSLMPTTSNFTWLSETANQKTYHSRHLILKFYTKYIGTKVTTLYQYTLWPQRNQSTVGTQFCLCVREASFFRKAKALPSGKNCVYFPSNAYTLQTEASRNYKLLINYQTICDTTGLLLWLIFICTDFKYLPDTTSKFLYVMSHLEHISTKCSSPH